MGGSVRIKWILWYLLMLTGCGSGNNTSAVRYYLEREATATTQNRLYLEIKGEYRPSFSLSGEGFTADVALDTIVGARDATELTADQFGSVEITLSLYQEDNRPYLTEVLPWKSSPEVPGTPEAYFSEDASADAWVYLIVPTSRGRNVKEVWVEGDIAEGGGFYDIPSDDQVLIQLSDGDGLKSLRVRYRNIFGTEGATANLVIARKSKPPLNCRALPVAPKTATGLIRTRILADNEGPLAFKVEGDVQTALAYRSFTDQTDEWIELSAGEGRKNIKVKIRDAAGNTCPDVPLSIVYDRNFRPGALRIEGDPIWTDDPLVTLLPSFERLEGDNIAMYISGGVVDDEQTFQWIPFRERLSVSLSPTHGTRHVIVQFRQDETVISEVTTPVFLRPFVMVSGTGASVQVIPSNIIGLLNLTLEGCAETYLRVAYASSFNCTPTAGAATITYYLQNGTSLTRSAAF
jgi:hypothetical protein